MKKFVENKKLIGACAASSAALGGLCYLTFREVMHRDAILPPTITKLAMKMMAKDAPAQTAPDERLEWYKAQKFEEYTIVNNKGYKLKGYLLRAEEPSNVFVFGSHGYRSNAKNEFRYMAKYHHDRGRNLFVVDHQAAGESDGTYIGFGYHEYRDCMLWLDFMLKTFGDDIQIILHGVSMGSATVMLMSGDDSLPDNVKFTVADCGYTSAKDEFNFVLKNAHIPTFPLIRGAEFFNKKINGYAFNEVDALDSVSHTKVPILFIHGTTDTFVPTFMAAQLFNACSSPDKDLLLVDGAWHAESYVKDSAGYEARVDSFAKKFIK